jgi:hypothetical protein
VGVKFKERKCEYSIMNLILLEGVTDFAQGVDLGNTAQQVTQGAGSAAINLLGNPIILVAAIILIVLTLVMVLHLKKVIENSILGGLLWAISVFFFHVSLPPIPSFVIAIIFGPAGIGAMLILKFFGLF